MSYLDDEHIRKIHDAYISFKGTSAFTSIVDNELILQDKNVRLSVQLYVKVAQRTNGNFVEILSDWEESSFELKLSMNNLFKTLENE